MRTITATLLTLLFLAAFSPVVSSRADDLDDGIAIDDGVQSYDQIGKSSQNFSYLAQRARSKAASGGGRVLTPDNGILNSVVLESGAEINGDIIIIDDSKGDKTIISQ